MKKRILTLLLALVMCLGLTIPALAASTVTVKVELVVDYSAAYEELELLNELRRQAGLQELVMDKAMMDMAVRRAAESAVLFSHTRPNGEEFHTARPSGYTGGTIGENLSYAGASTNADASAVTQSWYDSEGHRANMLNGTFTSVGIACVKDRAGQTYWVQNFYSKTGATESTPSSGQKGYIYSIETAPENLKLRLSEDSLDMETGEKTVVYVCNDRGTPLVPDIIRTSDDSVASLSMEDGGVCVSAAGAGSATLTLGCGGKSLNLPVSVSESSQEEVDLQLVRPEGGFRVEVGENIYTYVTPRHEVRWEVSDPSILEVSGMGHGARLTGLAPGTTWITAITREPVNGTYLSVMAEVTVYGKDTPEQPEKPEEPEEPDVPGQTTAPEEVDLSAYYVELIPGEQIRLQAYVRPDGASQKVTWSSKDSSVATVDQNGRITAVADGQTNVVATTQDGTEYRSCQVMVSSTYNGKPITFTDVKEGDYFYDAAAWATAQNLEIAPVGGALKVQQGCTRMEIVRYLWKLMGSSQPKDTSNNPFTDISNSVSNRDDRWAVQWAVENGVTTGMSATTFSPNTTVTRAQAVTFLHRAAGLPQVSGSAGFTDVPSNSWFADAAVWAVKEGITNGTGNNTFTPDKTCSRGEILTFLYRQFS